MKKNHFLKPRIAICALACLTFVSLLPATAKVKTVNLIDGTPELTGANEYTYVENGNIVLRKWEGVPYQSELNIPNLPNNYVMSGNIHIAEVIATGETDISIWNGLRIIIGKTDGITYNTISVYRNVGIQIVNNSTIGIGDIKPYPGGFSFADNTDFSFEIQKNGRSVVFSLNGTEVINATLAEGEDLFTDSANNNIGFISINTHFIVSDLEVLIEVEEETETETPEPSTALNPETGGKDACLVSLIVLFVGYMPLFRVLYFKKNKENVKGGSLPV